MTKLFNCSTIQRVKKILKQVQDDMACLFTIHRSQFTKSASWIIGGSKVNHSAFKLLSQFCRSFDLFTGTCWVRKAHTAHLPKSAFTLAETLIVIGIIGVVAALTLPNLNHATGDKEKVTKVKKIYSSLTEAFDRAQVIYGPIDEWFTDLNNSGRDINIRFGNRITEFLKTSKIECDDNIVSSNGIVKATLTDGSYITFLWESSDNMNMTFAQIYVDIDGPNKGKNRDGYDIFAFSVGSKGLLPGGYGYYNKSSEEYNNPSICFNMNYCTRWVIDNGNMDYLKADEEGKCPDGTQLSWTVTSCN